MSAYWWEANPVEKCWVEIRTRPGAGSYLEAPTVDVNGHRNGFYDLLTTVRVEDAVYHWNADEHRFVGRSFVDGLARAESGSYIVPLKHFSRLDADVSLTDVQAQADYFYRKRDELKSTYPGRLYLPFQFTQDIERFRFMSNYFAKLPVAFAERLFGTGSANPPSTSGSLPRRREFLNPFKPRADTDYESEIAGGRQKKSRSHETLVNSCSRWLETLGFTPAMNAAIDLGLQQPPTIIEAKTTHRGFTHAVRQAVAQLYEYRYFNVADPDAHLIFLADVPVSPSWCRYLESDRGIGALWPSANGFEGTSTTRRALSI